MVYHLAASMDEKNYWKVTKLSKVDNEHEDMCDLGTEALFIDTADHTKISLRINSNACSDFKESNAGIEAYMQFERELPVEMHEALARGELFLSEC